MIDSRSLKQLIEERQRYLEAYESLYAKLRHSWHQYDNKRRDVEIQRSQRTMMTAIYKAVCGQLKTPPEPYLHIATGNQRTCRRRKDKVKALPFYLREIEKLNEMIESQHKVILEKRREVRTLTHSSSTVQTNVPLNCSNGFVEFKNRSVKSSGEMISLHQINNVHNLTNTNW